MTTKTREELKKERENSLDAIEASYLADLLEQHSADGENVNLVQKLRRIAEKAALDH